MRSLSLLSLFLVACLFSCQQAQEEGLYSFSDAAADGKPDKAAATSTTTDILFQSTDGGKTWQDISAGLPAGLKGWSFFMAKGELLLASEQGLYKSGTAANHVHWEKDGALDQKIIHVSPNPAGMMAVGRNSQIYQKAMGTDVWMPIFTDFKNSTARIVFSAKDGSIFIGADGGLFKSANGGKTWNHVIKNGWVLKVLESNGVMLCTSQWGIMRSTDGGEHWENVLNEGGVGIYLTTINDGFAAINYNTESKTRRVRTSTDGGKTWQPIDETLPPSSLISTIQQVGGDFYCGHPDGIYRSVDHGKSWFLAVPATEKKVFNLFTQNGIIYALQQEGGC
ncbi:MAG: exo-alpha-sialidase [Saprospiraceae bacterium]|nr:exo-alpha-sialidase [Saprospiraceae bacterium]